MPGVPKLIQPSQKAARLISIVMYIDSGSIESWNINNMIHELDISDPNSLPDIQRGSTVLVGSDYSGQHAASDYESQAFILADIEFCQEWGAIRRLLRKIFLRDGRRISYKALRDKKRKEILPHFLNAANKIPGLLVVILTKKNIESLFKPNGRIERTDPEIAKYRHWSPRVLEKLLRIVHFLSLFVSGLSKSGQDILWITDEDDIAANIDRHQDLTKIFGHICSHYLKHNLRHLRVATTASDTGKRDVEDFVSIADLAAGALCEVLNTYLRKGVVPTPELVLPVPNELDDKAITLMNWFSDRTQDLKRLVLTIDPIDGSTSLSVKQLSFYGSKHRVA